MMGRQIKSFRHAINGVQLGWKETNFKTHILATFMVLVLAFLLKVSTIELMIVLICIAGVLSAELFNTAIEYMVNFISPDYHIQAKYIKDIAAGAVLIFAIFSAIIGLIIFIPKIFTLF